MARSTLVGFVSIAITARAPACSAPCTAAEPSPPTPITATTSPGLTPPRLTADPQPDAKPHEMSAAALRSYQGSIFTTEAS